MVEEKYDEDFKREYLQLAVAIGGALPVLAFLVAGGVVRMLFLTAAGRGPLPRPPARRLNPGLARDPPRHAV